MPGMWKVPTEWFENTHRIYFTASMLQMGGDEMSLDSAVRIISSLFTICQMYEITESEFIENGVHFDLSEDDKTVIRLLIVKMLKEINRSERYGHLMSRDFANLHLRFMDGEEE